MFDVHTHHLSGNPSEAMFSCCMNDSMHPNFQRARYLSAGIHPWYLTEEDINNQLLWLDELLAGDSRLLALGEAGLDKICPTPFQLQLKAFQEVINRSEHYEQPLLIHCVKASGEIIALKKKYTPRQPWIIHGFRGKKELALTYLRHGFYLSYGRYFHPEAVQATPSERLLLETDEASLPIQEVYKQVAAARKVSLNQLVECVDQNINFLFFSR